MKVSVIISLRKSNLGCGRFLYRVDSNRIFSIRTHFLFIWEKISIRRVCAPIGQLSIDKKSRCNHLHRENVAATSCWSKKKIIVYFFSDFVEKRRDVSFVRDNDGHCFLPADEDSGMTNCRVHFIYSAPVSVVDWTRSFFLLL